MVKTNAEYQQKLRDRRKVELNEIMDALFENSTIEKDGDSIVINWNLTSKEWPIIHKIAEIKGLTTDAMLEKMGRDIINKRSKFIKVGPGAPVPDNPGHIDL